MFANDHMVPCNEHTVKVAKISNFLGEKLISLSLKLTTYFEEFFQYKTLSEFTTPVHLESSQSWKYLANVLGNESSLSYSTRGIVTET